MPVFLRVAVAAAGVSMALAQTPPLIETLAVELDRNFRIFKENSSSAPYYIAYEVTERDTAAVSATLGALKTSRTDRARWLDVTVRVGSPQLDNFHLIPGDRAQSTSGAPLSIEDNPAAVRQRLWLETDRVYRRAAERLIKVRASAQVQPTEPDAAADFSKEAPAAYSEPAVTLAFPMAEAAARVRKWSAAFAGYPRILTSQAALSAQRETRYFVDSDGARIRHGRGSASASLSARAKAADGMDLVENDRFDAEDYAGLPQDEAALSTAARIAREVAALAAAPTADPFSGPAILSGRASAVLFHEIFGHRIEGHRQKDESEGRTFAASVGARVLPEFLSVSFDPTQRQRAGSVLNGFYLYDDEGVKARPVTVVDRGVLKAFLMSRSPLRGFARSNGHGRREPGHEVVSRQSSLIVETAQQVSEARLREMLAAEIVRQKKPYGLYFREVTGGFTNTSRQGVQTFKVIPIVVYRVYPDGRPDELVRGVDIVGTPLASFSKILAVSDRAEVFNGYCGAESGNIPVSSVSPAILVSEIEIERKEASQDRPPFLPPPPGGTP